MSPSRLVLASVLALLAACGSDSPTSACAMGTATCAVCPAGSTLRYTGGAPQNFGLVFMNAYCTRCHASTLSGAARQGAPDHANFDLLDVVREHAGLIDGRAGSGPAGTFTTMPPDAPTPSTEERARLSEWLACGAP
jgi:uncharacterized membrane protein